MTTTTTNQPQSQRLYSTAELAEFLAVGVRTVERYVREGKIPFLKIKGHGCRGRGGSLRFWLPDVIAALAEREGPAGQAAESPLGIPPELLDMPLDRLVSRFNTAVDLYGAASEKAVLYQQAINCQRAKQRRGKQHGQTS